MNGLLPCTCHQGLCPKHNPDAFFGKGSVFPPMAPKVSQVAAPLGADSLLPGESRELRFSAHRLFRPSTLCVDHRIARFFEVADVIMGKTVWTFPGIGTAEPRCGVPCSALPPIPYEGQDKRGKRGYPKVWEPFKTLNQGEIFKLIVRNLGKKSHYFSALLYGVVIDGA